MARGGQARRGLLQDLLAQGERDLTAAYKFYCGKDLTGAHRAEADVRATAEILWAQSERYADLPKDVAGIEEWTNKILPGRVDADGKFIWKNGEAVFDFAKHNGKSLRDVVRSDRSYLTWMVDKANFSPDVTRICREALEGQVPGEEGLNEEETNRRCFIVRRFRLHDCLVLGQEEYSSVVALSIRYGQRHVKELNAARAVARAAKVQIHEVSLTLPWLSGSSLTNMSLRIPDMPLKKSAKAASLDLRPRTKHHFLVVSRFSRGTPSAPKPSSSAPTPWIIRATRTAALRSSGLSAASPSREPSAVLKASRLRSSPRFCAWIKRGRASGSKVGAPLRLTWSCYAGQAKQCHRCDSCKLRAKKGFREAGLQDPPRLL